MKLKDFAFLCDENINPIIYQFFIDQQLNIANLSDHGLKGETDSTILEFAHQHNAVVLTHDSDFGSLIYSNAKAFTGIVYLRPGHMNSQIHIETLNTLFDYNPEVIAPFIIVAENTNRAIKLRVRNALSL